MQLRSGLTMYFCYGIKNSSLETATEISAKTERRDSQQIELTIPQNRIKQTFRQRNDAINKSNPNGLTTSLSSDVSQSWQTFN